MQYKGWVQCRLSAVDGVSGVQAQQRKRVLLQTPRRKLQGIILVQGCITLYSTVYGSVLPYTALYPVQYKVPLPP